MPAMYLIMYYIYTICTIYIYSWHSYGLRNNFDFSTVEKILLKTTCLVLSGLSSIIRSFYMGGKFGKAFWLGAWGSYIFLRSQCLAFLDKREKSGSIVFNIVRTLDTASLLNMIRNLLTWIFTSS